MKKISIFLLLFAFCLTSCSWFGIHMKPESEETLYRIVARTAGYEMGLHYPELIEPGIILSDALGSLWFAQGDSFNALIKDFSDKYIDDPFLKEQWNEVLNLFEIQINFDVPPVLSPETLERIERVMDAFKTGLIYAQTLRAD